MAKTWYVHCRDNRSLEGGTVTWEIFTVAFVDQIFPREIREEKVTEFINLLQREMSVHEYSLEFVKLSKYAPSIVSNPETK